MAGPTLSFAARENRAKARISEVLIIGVRRGCNLYIGGIFRQRSVLVADRCLPLFNPLVSPIAATIAVAVIDSTTTQRRILHQCSDPLIDTRTAFFHDTNVLKLDQNSVEGTPHIDLALGQRRKYCMFECCRCLCNDHASFAEIPLTW